MDQSKLFIVLLTIFCVLCTTTQSSSPESEEQKEKNLETRFIEQILTRNPVQNSEIPTIKSLLLDMQRSIAALVVRENERTAAMKELRAALTEFRKYQSEIRCNAENPSKNIPENTSEPPSTISTTTEDTTTERQQKLVFNQSPLRDADPLPLQEHVDALQMEVQSNRNVTHQFFQTYCQVTLGTLEGSTSAKNLKSLYNFCNQFQNIPAKPFLGEAVLRPKARLYNGLNMTGDYEDYNFEGTLHPKCLTVTSKLAGKLRSIETFGTCVRLYTGRYSCDGKSMAFYPRISGPEDQEVQDRQRLILETSSSIGPCYDNELDESYIEMQVYSNEHGIHHRKKFRKLTNSNKNIQIVPDFLPSIGRPSDYKPTYGYPVTQYRTSQNGRIDYINAHVTINDIRRGERDSSVVSEEAKTAFQNGYIYAEKQEGDLMGFYIGSRLGAQKEVAFNNVFPQTAQNQKLMYGQEQKIINLPWTSTDYASIHISVNYETENGTRPIGLLYWVSYGKDQWSAAYLSNLHA